MTFTSFSTQGLVSLPPELFTQVLPAITLPSELKVTLHMFYRLSRQRGTPRRISWDDLVADHQLRQSLRSISKLRSPEELLEEGLDAAVRRTTILHLAHPGEGRMINWYLINTPANRTWVEQIGSATTALYPNPNAAVPEQHPSLLMLYEQNIGLVPPLLLDELCEVEERYPYEWIEEAMREAVRSNIRSWRYVRKVLERWESHGREPAPYQVNGREPTPYQVDRHRPIDVEKYTNGAFGSLFRASNDTNI